MIEHEDRQRLIDRFEAEMSKVQRPGVDKLMDYIRKSDFYTAPASTRFHLSCEGGLLQHSLNVLDALRMQLDWNPQTNKWDYQVAGRIADSIPEESVIIMALLHDICKTYFYTTSTRNQKNEATGKWEKVPFYTIKDRMPLGHGAKSAMIVKQYMDLTNREMYAIWWHMGFSEGADANAVGGSIELYPIVLALQTADMAASRIMEAEKGNKAAFLDPAPVGAAQDAAAQASAPPPLNDADAPPMFEEAPPLEPGA